MALRPPLQLPERFLERGQVSLLVTSDLGEPCCRGTVTHAAALSVTRLYITAHGHW
jgi:hypothetical protein